MTETLSITVNTGAVDDMIDGRAISDRMRGALSRGVQKSLAVTQQVHKRQVLGRTGGAVRDDVWTVRTNEAGRSFHIAQQGGSLEGAYGSDLVRVGVLEMGTQEALGGPLRPRRAKYLAIPTDAARVGVGRAVSPKDRSDLVFVISRRGNPVLLQKDTGELMFGLKREVTIPPRPTLARTVEVAQPAIDRAMLEAVDIGLSPGGSAT